MAKQINLSARFQILDSDGVALIEAAASSQITQVETGTQLVEQSIGLTTEALTLTDIDNVGYVFVKNTDPTNFVEIGTATPVSSSNALITLKAGEFAIFPSRLETIYAKADTGACVLRHAVAEL